MYIAIYYSYRHLYSAYIDEDNCGEMKCETIMIDAPSIISLKDNRQYHTGKYQNTTEN
jgi:hypothetical protein